MKNNVFWDFKIKIYRTIILPVVLYGCENWSLTLREEHRLRVFQNRVLRIFGHKKDEVTEEWRKLHYVYEENNGLYSSPNSTGSFVGVRCGRGVTLTAHPLLVLRSKIE